MYMYSQVHVHCTMYIVHVQLYFLCNSCQLLFIIFSFCVNFLGHMENMKRNVLKQTKDTVIGKVINDDIINYRYY